MLSALIPAAGLSSRMGSAKALLAWGGESLIKRAITAAAQVCGQVVVVLGHEGAEVESVLGADAQLSSMQRQGRLIVVHNPGYRRGMLSSIRCGARRIAGDWFFIAPVDMPLLSPDVFCAVKPSHNCDAVFPLWQGRRGHPVLVSAALIPQLLRCEPEPQSMREFLSSFHCCEVPALSRAVLVDIDTAEEYRELAHAHGLEPAGVPRNDSHQEGEEQ